MNILIQNDCLLAESVRIVRYICWQRGLDSFVKQTNHSSVFCITPWLFWECLLNTSILSVLTVSELREAVKKGKADAIKNEVHIISKNMAFYVEYCPGIQREVCVQMGFYSLCVVHRSFIVNGHMFINFMVNTIWLYIIYQVFEAQCKLEDIERAKKKESDVHIVINQRTMSAISGFKNPPKKVHRVMQGAFLLLGYDLDKTSVCKLKILLYDGRIKLISA